MWYNPTPYLHPSLEKSLLVGDFYLLAKLTGFRIPMTAV
jgi:hypothetical protein